MLRKLVRRLRGRVAGDSPPPRAPILDQYVRAVPSAQNAVDIFKGEWWSRFPDEFGVSAGALLVSDDPRYLWAIEALGGVEDRTIVELGPLEGLHTYLLEKAGARSVVAIEANTRNFLKCLIAKEVLGLQRARYRLGDFEDYLRSTADRFDVAIASGVLYHVRNPVELIHNLARVSDRVFIWTHYFVAERLARIPHMAHRVGASHPAEYAGFAHTLHRYNYGDFLAAASFAGGSEEFSHWLGREDLLGAVRHAGLGEIRIGEENLEHTNGPCISLVATRKP